MGEELDWRHNLVTTVEKRVVNHSWGLDIPRGASIYTVSETKVKKKKLTIPIPNATAILINISENACQRAKELRKISKIDSTSQKKVAFESSGAAFDYLELKIQSIIMAFTAIEAFINEFIPDGYEYWHHKNSDLVLERAEKREIERRFSTCQKLDVILPEILNIESPKGKREWTSYRRLKQLRDRIIHMKSEDRVTSHENTKTIWDDLVKSDPAHAQALEIISYFLKAAEDQPRWFKLYNKR